MDTSHYAETGLLRCGIALVACSIIAVLSIGGCKNSETSSSSSSSYSLDFSENGYSTSSMSVTTGSGTYSITYHLYQNIVYVSKPINEKYESMNVYVPVKINNTSVSTTNVPILLEIGVGGYMSCSTWGSTNLSTNGQYALAAGYVVAQPGCRGRDNESDGSYYGKAPAAIVDLKAAVRYIRYNSGSFPGNVDRIVSSGGSAGGALSALLGASGNSSLYDSYLTAIGAADADDNIWAVAAYSPITNLDHADMCYEWEYGSVDYNGSTVNQTISGELKSLFESYQDGLGLTGRDSFGAITASNIDDYILEYYLEPSAAKYIATNGNSWTSWITYSGGSATFSFSDYVSYIGRGKSVPAFDAFFDSSSYSDTNTSTTPEVSEFGSSTTNARHFTDYSLQKTTGDSSETISSDLQTIVNMMNPMYFVLNNNSGMANHWFIRDGAKATDTSAIVIVDLATALEDKVGTSNVDAWEYWEGGHNVNEDPDTLMSDIATWNSSDN